MVNFLKKSAKLAAIFGYKWQLLVQAFHEISSLFCFPFKVHSFKFTGCVYQFRRLRLCEKSLLCGRKINYLLTKSRVLILHFCSFCCNNYGIFSRLYRILSIFSKVFNLFEKENLQRKAENHSHIMV